jgi:hypothetical protein
MKCVKTKHNGRDQDHSRHLRGVNVPGRMMRD